MKHKKPSLIGLAKSLAARKHEHRKTTAIAPYPTPSGSDHRKSSKQGKSVAHSIKQQNKQNLHHKQLTNRPSVQPYTAHDRVLLIGEANFSFALALARMLFEKGESAAQEPDEIDSNDDGPGLARIPFDDDDCFDSVDDDFDDNDHSPSTGTATGWIVATTLDSHAVTMEKYPDAMDILSALTTDFPRRVRILFGVDATQLHTDRTVMNAARDLEKAVSPTGDRHGMRSPTFTKVAFNFPHVGLGIKEQTRNIVANQRMLAGFLTSVRLLCERVKRKQDAAGALASASCMRGYQLVARSQSSATMTSSTTTTSLLITLKTGLPYDSWRVKDLARAAGYTCRTSFPFDATLFPGYAHRRTLGFEEGRSAEANEELMRQPCRTAVYVMNEEGSGDSVVVVGKTNSTSRRGKRSAKGEESGDSE